MQAKIRERWPILIVVALVLYIVWGFLDAEKTSSAYDARLEFAARQIEMLDSTIQDLRVQKAEVELAISAQDSLIARLEYQRWKLREQVRLAVNDLNQTYEYNETDSALVELLRSAYSERLRARN